MTGIVYLVGAGPGDPELLTLRAARLLAKADVVVVDALVTAELLQLARSDALVIDVGKTAGACSAEQASINALLVAHARTGCLVVRLKGGDPFMFGRGGEEALALKDAGIPFEVVPGVSAALAASAYAGIPLVHRDVASTVTFTTGHAGHVAAHESTRGQTLVIYMCGRTVTAIAADLVARGWLPDTPIAIVESATRPEQRVLTSTLEELALLEGLVVRRPALAIVGAVAKLADRLSWFGAPPMSVREGTEAVL